MNPKTIAFLIAAILLIVLVFRKLSFHSLPKEQFQHFEVNIKERFEDGEYQLDLSNPIHCPVRFFLSSEIEAVNQYLQAISPLVLAARADTTLAISGHGDLKEQIKMGLKIGDPGDAVTSTVLAALPFPKHQRYKLLQGNNSGPTHNSTQSRYAFDFTMKTGDTICSVQNGYVIGVIDAYDGWGYSDKWKPYANQVMIYDTSTHLITMYGHLKHSGSLVKLGDYVTIGQPIALSGQTGLASEEHLHFNVLQAVDTESGLKSFQLDSFGNYKVSELKRYQTMKH